MSWSYTSKVSERWDIAALSGHSKLYTILPDFVAQRVKLDLAKHFGVPLCRSYEPNTSIYLVAVDGFYSPDRRPRGIREVRDEECLVTLLPWRHNNEAVLGNPPIPAVIALVPSSLENSPAQLRGFYPKAGHYRCLLLARAFPSLPLGME